MKLSEMDSVTKLKTMGRLTPVIARICEDEAVSDALARAIPRIQNSKTNLQRWGAVLGEVGETILSDHPMDLIEIDSIMTGRTFEEINEPGHNMIADFRDFFDGEFLDFFTQFMGTGKKKS